VSAGGVACNPRITDLWIFMKIGVITGESACYMTQGVRARKSLSGRSQVGKSGGSRTPVASLVRRTTSSSIGRRTGHIPMDFIRRLAELRISVLDELLYRPRLMTISRKAENLSALQWLAVEPQVGLV
jgi:hypothetical protein